MLMIVVICFASLKSKFIEKIWFVWLQLILNLSLNGPQLRKKQKQLMQPNMKCIYTTEINLPVTFTKYEGQSKKMKTIMLFIICFSEKS